MFSLANLFGSFFINNSIEKNSVYECGFDTFSLNPIIKNFEIEFLLIALLFLIFDLEIMLLIPWILFYSHLGIFGYLIFLIFLIILLIGFLIEYFRGILHWNLAIKKN
jgi:NADH:ubiquinone oxidoreductase subunit 3 (subunit A)